MTSCTSAATAPTAKRFSKRNASEDQQQRDQHREPALIAQLVPYLRADEFHAPHIGRHLEGRIEHAQDPIGEFRAARFALWRDPHEHVFRSTEMLHLDVLESGLIQRVADRLKFHLFREPDLDQITTREVDPELQSLHGERDDGRQQQRTGEDEGPPPVADELELPFKFEPLHR